MEPCYVTRARLRAALEYAVTEDALVDQAIAQASRTIDGQCHRRFYPTSATRYFDWPDDRGARAWRLWLDQHDLISVTGLTIGGEAATTADFLLEPVNDGPPYTHIEADLSTTSSFDAGPTHQRAIAITGLWGYNNDVTTATTTAEALDDSETEVTVTHGGKVDAGDLVTVGSERMVVTDVLFVTSGTTLNDALTAMVNDQSVGVASSASFAVGETLEIDAERMRIRAVASGILTVDRAVDGTTLAAHTTSTQVNVNRSLTVERGATGSTAAAASSGATVYRQVYPPLIVQWTLAQATVELAQSQAAYARTAGGGDNEIETVGRGLMDIRERALASHARRMRHVAV